MRIFEFDDYKPFLTQFIRQQPRKGRGMIKTIAEYLGVDPSQVSQVLSGSKDFTEEQALALAKFVGLNELELEYFLTLVKIERAGSKALKDHYRKTREQLREKSLNLSHRLNQDRILSDYEKSVFYSSHLYSAIRLATSIGDGQTVSEISERFQIPIEKAAEILGFLASVDLCRESDGRFKLGTQHTHVGRGSPFLLQHHHNWRIKSLERVQNITEKEMQFTGPVSLGEKEFQAIREILVSAVSKSLDLVKASEPTDVACLLIDWFWLKK